ncbi:MAG: hypothetical protein FD130_535 [Halothiobacillaceae bacterium]|nr:MAG: hypothetical protein FD130_535 [Halothiobacillaceae bacterium]
MPAIDCYVDTSALIKLYVAEPQSEAVEKSINTLHRPLISSLSILEWHCVMNRRWRSGAFDDAYHRIARAEFARHLASGAYRVHALHEGLYAQATYLLESVTPLSLRTLDALHLAAAQSAQASTMATADKVMAQAANQLGLGTIVFFN